jgi:hypothetical protein
MVNAYTYTDVLVILEPVNDVDPGGAWYQTVSAYLLAPPFGKYQDVCMYVCMYVDDSSLNFIIEAKLSIFLLCSFEIKK